MEEKNYYKQLGTKQLFLKEVEESSAKELWDDIYSDYDYYKTYMNEEIEDYETYFNMVSSYKELYEKGNHFRWAIYSKIDNHILGLIQLRKIDLINNNCSAAWILMKQEQGKGYMVEAASEVFRFAFENLNMNRIECSILEENEKSIALAEKLGMIKEGIRRESWKENEEYKNDCIYSLIKSDRR